MKTFCSIVMLLFALSIHAQTGVVRDIITDPNVSLRCKEMVEDRNDKVKVKQKLNSLLQRNQRLLRISPKQRVALRKKLQSSDVQLKNELYLTELQIQSMEESIVRSGCPGINL